MTTTNKALERSADLLPCPFCGSVDVHGHFDGFSADFVECHTCGAASSRHQHKTADDAAKAWNTRAQAADGVMLPNDPADDVMNLLGVIADIREKSGVGKKPMLYELADAIKEKMDALNAPANNKGGA